MLNGPLDPLDYPTFASSAHTHTVYNPNEFTAQVLQATTAANQASSLPKVRNVTMVALPTRRLVRVLVVDPNENIPLSDSVIYKGDELLTDLTDQELFFDISIQELLKTHNEKRVKIIDKRVKDRTEYLEPAKIRDLKMVVVTIAQF